MSGVGYTVSEKCPGIVYSAGVRQALDMKAIYILSTIGALIVASSALDIVGDWSAVVNLLRINAWIGTDQGSA